jgi:hypothetical protein
MPIGYVIDPTSGRNLAWITDTFEVFSSEHGREMGALRGTEFYSKKGEPTNIYLGLPCGAGNADTVVRFRALGP